MSDYFKEGIRNFKRAVRLEKAEAAAKKISYFHWIVIGIVLTYFIMRFV